MTLKDKLYVKQFLQDFINHYTLKESRIDFCIIFTTKFHGSFYDPQELLNLKVIKKSKNQGYYNLTAKYHREVALTTGDL